TGKSKLREMLTQDVLDGHAELSGRTVGELAEHNPGKSLEDPCSLQGREHAVDAVAGFGDVLEEKDTARWQCQRPCRLLAEEDREVAANERPTGHPGYPTGELSERRGRNTL